MLLTDSIIVLDKKCNLHNCNCTGSSCNYWFSCMSLLGRDFGKCSIHMLDDGVKGTDFDTIPFVASTDLKKEIILSLLEDERFYDEEGKFQEPSTNVINQLVTTAVIAQVEQLPKQEHKAKEEVQDVYTDIKLCYRFDTSRVFSKNRFEKKQIF